MVIAYLRENDDYIYLDCFSPPSHTEDTTTSTVQALRAGPCMVTPSEQTEKGSRAGLTYLTENHQIE